MSYRLLKKLSKAVEHSSQLVFNLVSSSLESLNAVLMALGFLPKAIFLERLAVDRKSISVFFLLSILSVSARFTKCLIERYGDASKATDYFIMKASDLLPSEIYNPSLERTQALLLLGISEWTQGNRTRSAVRHILYPGLVFADVSDPYGNCCPKYATLKK